MGGERLWLIGANALQKNQKGEVFWATKPGTTDLSQGRWPADSQRRATQIFGLVGRAGIEPATT